MQSNHNISELFFNAAKLYPNKLAIIENNKQISFKELAEEVRNTAAHFSKKGLIKGDRVLVFIPMGIDLYRTVLALFYMGCTAVFLDEWVSKKRLELCCELAECKGFVGTPKASLLSIISKQIRKIPIKIGKKYTIAKAIEMATIEFDDAALITFTTGSTGTPKAALRSHGFLKAQFDALIAEIKPSPNDIDMSVLPIVLFVNLGVGCTSVIADFNARKPNNIKPHKIANQITQHKANRLMSSPFFVKELSRYIINSKQVLPTITKIFTGGAPVFPTEATLYNKAFERAAIKIVYGSTEAEPISSIDSKIVEKEDLKRGLNVGAIFPKTQLKIIPITNDIIEIDKKDELNEFSLKEREIGEIIVAGNHVLKTYYNNPIAFKKNKIVVDGEIWHRTGDSGYIDDKGHLNLCGRCEQVYTYNKRLISPFIIENTLQTINGIVIGTIILIDNQQVLFIELEKRTDKRTVEKEIKSLDIAYNQLKILNKIPRDPRHNSKIDYPKLKLYK